jgi:DNA-binding winged helix-turn-helix (wHTH) protein
VNVVGNTAFRIGQWRVDPALDEIVSDDTTVKLEHRTMRVLVCLAERAGEVVSVNQLLDIVWKDLVVTHYSVYQAVAVLRRALGDDPKNPTYIANVARRGYGLIMPVEADRTAERSPIQTPPPVVSEAHAAVAPTVSQAQRDAPDTPGASSINFANVTLVSPSTQLPKAGSLGARPIAAQASRFLRMARSESELAVACAPDGVTESDANGPRAGLWLASAVRNAQSASSELPGSKPWARQAWSACAASRAAAVVWIDRDRLATHPRYSLVDEAGSGLPGQRLSFSAPEGRNAITV